MTAAWMLYGTVVTGILWLGTSSLEHAASTLRRPARFLWLGALTAALVISGARLLSPVAVQPRASLDAVARAGGPGHSPPTRSAPPSPAAPRFLDTVAVPPWLDTLDVPLRVLWAIGSLFGASVLVGSAAHLRRRRAEWRPEVVDGVPVHVSHDVGPALFGVARYSVVVPAWVLELPPEQRRLILAHEREHAGAGDPLTLLAGAVLVLVQPWNPAAWLMLRRLRFAVEADCDARVIARSSAVRPYAEMLLEVGTRVLAGAAPVAALSEPHSHLARRVHRMTRAPLPRPRLRGLASLSVAGVLAAGACRTPHPVSAPPADPGRALVHLTSVALEDVGGPIEVLVFSGGPARVGLGAEAPTELGDTLRLASLPAITADVTEADVHLRLSGPGRMRVEGAVTGGPANRVGGSGREIILLKGGVGVRILHPEGSPVASSDDPAGRPALEPSRAQVVFEEYLRGGLTLEQAADALVDLTLRQRSAGGSMAGWQLRRPANGPVTAETERRAGALFDELDRRASGR